MFWKTNGFSEYPGNAQKSLISGTPKIALRFFSVFNFRWFWKIFDFLNTQEKFVFRWLRKSYNSISCLAQFSQRTTSFISFTFSEYSPHSWQIPSEGIILLIGFLLSSFNSNFSTINSKS